MTDHVRAKAEELKQVILDSDEYRSFDMYRRLLNETPQLKARVNEFRAANVEMQMSHDGENRNAMQELADDYNDLLTNSVVREFLNAELILCKMMQRIDAILVSDLELELDFL
ncbi:MAG: YlbF family regulator [Lachnospiraceae bacterium]